jgi:hypothetical protein
MLAVLTVDFVNFDRAPLMQAVAGTPDAEGSLGTFAGITDAATNTGMVKCPQTTHRISDARKCPQTIHPVDPFLSLG